MITFAACTITPPICADIITPFLTASGTSPPTEFPSITKKPAPDNSYELKFYSNDPTIAGK